MCCRYGSDLAILGLADKEEQHSGGETDPEKAHSRGNRF